MKTSHSAVVAIPPREAWEPIQEIRRRHDRQIGRWMPHVTLLYPFWPRARFAEAASLLARAAASVTRFTVTLREFRSFAHARSTTIWLAPEPAAPLVGLHGALAAAIPECDDTSRFANGFTPHLSVGQGRRGRETAALVEELQRAWTPLPFELTEIALIAREGEGPFEVERVLPLGRAG